MKTGALCAALSVFVAISVYGERIPAELVRELAADEFTGREAAQKNLLDWARKGKRLAAKELFQLSEGSEDPEIRQRCSLILRTLSDEDYLQDGTGYLGINMAEEKIAVPEGEKMGFGIRVIDVMRGSPADMAGVKRGDLITGLNDKTWQEEGALDRFREAIAKMKPLTEVDLAINREALEPLKMRIALGKSPVLDLRAVRGNLQLLDEHARAQHFKEWMKLLRLKGD